MIFKKIKLFYNIMYANSVVIEKKKNMFQILKT